MQLQLVQPLHRTTGKRCLLQPLLRVFTLTRERVGMAR